MLAVIHLTRRAFRHKISASISPRATRKPTLESLYSITQSVTDPKKGPLRSGLRLARTAARDGDAKAYAAAVNALVALAKLELTAGRLLEPDAESESRGDRGDSDPGEDGQSAVLRIARRIRTG